MTTQHKPLPTTQQRYFSAFEITLWSIGIVATLATSIACNSTVATTIASLIGITSLILVAKGNVIGQVLMVIFGIMYGIISYTYGYYGETITYVGMTVPMALLATISWLRHPHQGKKHQVKISHLSTRQVIILPIATIAVTAIFYFVLGAFDTASLIVSTLSITTSFVAVYLSYCRNPYYALAYASNDLVLIVLWVIASIGDPSNISMLVCFVLFLVNDIYGFVNWRALHRTQTAQHSQM